MEAEYLKDSLDCANRSAEAIVATLRMQGVSTGYGLAVMGMCIQRIVQWGLEENDSVSAEAFSKECQDAKDLFFDAMRLMKGKVKLDVLSHLLGGLIVTSSLSDSALETLAGDDFATLYADSYLIHRPEPVTQS